MKFGGDSGDGLVEPRLTPRLGNNPPSAATREETRRRFYRTKFRLIAKLSMRKTPRRLQHLIDDMFLGGTTGLDRLMATHGNWFRFAIWLMTYVALVACVGYCVYRVVEKYLLYGTAISISTVEPDALEFPAVTICNLNFLRKSSFCRDEGIFHKFRDHICTQANLTRESVFVLLSINPKIMKRLNKTVEEEHTAESQRQILDILGQHAIHWNSTIKSCQLVRKTCLRSDLIKMQTSTNPEYGMCFTLFEGGLRLNLTGVEREKILDITSPSDPSEGLHLVLDLNEEEYLPFQTEKGFVLIVHSVADAPDVSRGGVYIPSDRRTYVAIGKEIVKLREPPYDTGCQPSQTWPKKILSLYPHLAKGLRGKHYSAVTCEFICRALNVIEVCQCEGRHGIVDYALTCVERISRRGRETNFTCKEEFTRAPLETAKKYGRPMRCFCPPKCEDAVFMNHVSYTRLRSGTTADNDQQHRKLYAEILVYFKEIRHDVLSMTPTYSYGKMMNEVGGFLGSFVGMAFVSIYEIAESLLITILHLVSSKTHF